MATVNIHAAKTHFSSLLERVAAGEEIVIARAGKPIAMLTPLGPRVTAKRKLGRLSGRAEVPSDFDTPLPDSVLDAFEGS